VPKIALILHADAALKTKLLALLVVALAACSDRPAGEGPSASATASQGAAVTVPAAAPGDTRFAGHRDDGRIAVVDAGRPSYRSGPHLWQPAKFSEAHALQALQSGHLTLPRPDGGSMDVRTERHVEHDDGNWTFIGKTADGGDAVITFGPDAVFGSVQTATGTIRLTTDSRGGWLVSSPRGSDGMAPASGAGDVLIPPHRAKLLAGAPRLAPASRTAAKTVEAATAQTDPVVDVVVGFTTGFAQARGGDSAARTRVNNLIEITNQAYVNSGLAARVRLAHALQVDFPDATKNADALYKLTGYDTAAGAVAVDPGLQPLRAAREQYFGDVAVLLRPLRSPESDGCGIAWLLGGGMSPIDASDAAFAFSVVSDGTDLNESDNKTYFCREESFAHELGHLMGQAHNVEEASGAGAHAYAYGYRQATTNGFFTVMAYRLKDSNQQGIRYFANPQVSYNGVPTGVADQADNVRSLQQTMPIVAGFRVAPVVATVRRVVNDLDGDGLSDMVWQGLDAGYFETWRMEGQRLARALGFQLPTGNRVVTAGDFNGDRRLDLLVRDAANALVMYEGNGVTFSVIPMGRSSAANWRAIGSTDIDGDGNSDVLWLHPDSNQFELWFMQGATVKGTRAHTMPTDTRVATTGDFSGDGKADVLVVNEARELSLWLGNGQAFSVQRLSITTPVAPGWVVWGDIDMNADSRADLLWSTPATSYFEWWNMLGATVQRASGATPPADQRVAGSGDFNGDGMADMLLAGSGNDLHVGISDGVLFNRTPLNIVAGPGWKPFVAGKF
jgi:hypothetical protein